jgi:hypothetical protein
MGRTGKRRRSRRSESRRRVERQISEPRDLLEDVFESGGDLFLAVGYTPGGFPFGPRVEIGDGQLVFPDELPGIDPLAELEGEDSRGEGPPLAYPDVPF